MKVLVILLLPILSYSQTMFKMEMNIKEVKRNYAVECSNATEVIWGHHADTVGFVFNDTIMVFYPVTDKALKRLDNGHAMMLYNSIKNSLESNHKILILQDSLDDTYTIRTVIDEDKGTFVIFVTNLNCGIPNYVFGWKCSECFK